MELSDQYIAGLFDGEGHVCIGHDDKRMNVGVSSCDRRVLDALHDRFGGHVIEHRRKLLHQRTLYQWVLRKKDEQRTFLEAVKPWVVVKGEAVAAAFAFLATCKNLGGDRHVEVLSKDEWQIRKEARQVLYRVNANHGQRLVDRRPAYAC